MEKMTMSDKLKPGDKVTYNTSFKKEIGIVKSFNSECGVFVVYNCGEDWENYSDYTAALTKKEDLVKGWIKDE